MTKYLTIIYVVFVGDMCIYIYIYFFFFFKGPHLWHREVPRLGVESELHPLAYATATWDPSHICDVHHSPRHRRILNPLSKASDQTLSLMVPSRILFHYTMMGTPRYTVIFLGIEMSIFMHKPFSIFSIIIIFAF